VDPPGDRLQDVALRENSDQTAVLEDRGGTDVVPCHPLGRLAQRVFRSDGDDLAGHQLAEGGHASRIAEKRYTRASLHFV
jgi:hypothetical protein